MTELEAGAGLPRGPAPRAAGLVADPHVGGALPPDPRGADAEGAGASSSIGREDLGEGPSIGTKAARGTLWLAASSWSSKGLQVVLLLVVARALRPDQVGVFAAVTLVLNVLVACNHLGLRDALAARDDRVLEAARTATTLVVGTGILLALGGFLLAPELAGFFHKPGSVWLLRGFVAAVLFEAVAEVPIAMVTRELEFKRRVATDACPALVGTAVSIGLVVEGFGLVGLLVGQLVWEAVRVVAALGVGHPVRPGFDRRLAGELLRFGAPLGATVVATLLLLNVDYLIVGHALGPAQLGVYSLAYRVCYLPFLAVPFVVNGVAFPYYCRLGDRSEVASAIARVVLLVMAAVAPMSGLLALFAGDIALLGHRWAPAAPVIRWLALYAAGLTLAYTATIALAALRSPQLTLGANLFHLALLAAVLVPTVHEGIVVVGADQAAVAWAVALLALGWLVRKGVPGRKLLRALGVPAGATVALALAGFALQAVPGLGRVPAWPPLLLVAPLAALAYAAVLYGLAPGELQRSWRALRNR